MFYYTGEQTMSCASLLYVHGIGICVLNGAGREQGRKKHHAFIGVEINAIFVTVLTLFQYYLNVLRKICIYFLMQIILFTGR